jgi:hypothetical protein
MASSADLTSAKSLMEAAMVELQRGITEVMTTRNKVATGGTRDSMTTEVNSYENLQGNTFGITARLAANANWKWVGNGRGPGGPPPVTSIQRWIDAKGLSLNAWAVAKKIGAEGSADYRAKRTNVFEDGITAWQFENDNLVNAAGAIADAMAQTVVVDLQTGLR